MFYLQSYFLCLLEIPNVCLLYVQKTLWAPHRQQRLTVSLSITGAVLCPGDHTSSHSQIPFPFLYNSWACPMANEQDRCLLWQGESANSIQLDPHREGLEFGGRETRCLGDQPPALRLGTSWGQEFCFLPPEQNVLLAFDKSLEN